LNNASLSQKPKHVASNDTDKNSASTDRLYLLFVLQVSKRDVTGKDNKINRGGGKPQVLHTEPQSQTRRNLLFQVIQLHEHPLHQNCQQLRAFKLLTVHHSAPAATGQFFTHLESLP
jgi:hypothetical protein